MATHAPRTALVALAAAPQLPVPLTTLIGRGRDAADVRRRLAGTRLLTLVGPGGVGKTRLAIEVAGGVGEAVWWLDLVSVGGAVESALVRALGVRPLPGLRELDAAAGLLWDKRALLVLDNCEHVAAEVARMLETLLQTCPRLRVLATSRIPLGVEGETRWAVPPLSPADAERLFADRARLVDRTWSGPAREICRRLEGVPLALELAAARVVALDGDAIARGLEDAVQLLTARHREGDLRHRSLRASLDWSYGLLDPPAQVLLTRLAVFSGGASLDRVHEVCGGDLDAVETLAEHSLVQVEAGGRYRLLEVVRQYALERLVASGEEATVRGRHRDAFLALAERLRAETLTPRQPEVFAALDPEASNLSAAFEHALVTEPEKALRLCLALDFWYRARARFREADDAYGRALAATEPAPEPHARALAAWAWIVGSGGDFTRANALAMDAAARARRTGDGRTIANTLLVLANHRFFTDPLGAVDLLERCRDCGDEYEVARTEALLRGVAWFRQDAGACREDLDALGERLERLGDRETLAWFWFEQGAVGYPLGEHAESAALLRRAIAAAADIGEPTADRAARAYLALLDVAAGRSRTALDQLRAIHARTLLHGGSFALPWLEVLVALAEAASGDLGAARTRLRTLVTIEAFGAAHALAWARAELAEVLRLSGERCEEEAARALAAARALRNPWLAAKAQLTLGRATRSEQTLHAALAAIDAGGLKLELPGALEALAAIATDDVTAGRLAGAAERARSELEVVAWPAQRAELVTGSDAARAEGAQLTVAEVVAWVQRARGARKRPGHGWESLTPTEIAVVRHAAAGLTNPQIAERLFIARATVKTHLSHVYAKVGVRNRSQLASEAAGRLPPG
ncbi:helix-turn-helix transcriptional regulator [Solirubrobacter soli]|uniref:helix-turn-helix transcriptional regulator n=1 Tax=Solirubrobacter soli TaxID=363832 RepID=UPI000427F936|nr:LuxR C-terminal-related transcriptional regulator [Solirubrobacter soli]